MDNPAFVPNVGKQNPKNPKKDKASPEYDNRLLAKMYKLITGRDVGSDGDKFHNNNEQTQQLKT